MIKKIFIIFIITVVFLMPPEVFALNFVCGEDVNKDGEIDDQGETMRCITTDQGYLCPISAVDCTKDIVCPLGDYACNSNSCAKPGNCTLENVNLTQYQCPSGGQVYDSQQACNDACQQTTNCVYTQGQVTLSGGYHDPNRLISSVEGQGNRLVFYGGSNPVAYVDISGATVSGYADSSYACGESCPIFFIMKIVGSGNELIFYNDAWQEAGRITVTGATVAGTIEGGSAIFYISGSGNGLYGGWNSPSGQIVFTSTQSAYTCPLGGSYPCTGNPPVCTKAQTCQTQTITGDKYKCSVTNSYYDTEQQCSSACTQTSTCEEGYKCPLGQQYNCMNNNGTYQCSPNQCSDLDINPAQITTVDSNMLQDDGPKDQDGNCLGTIYLFTGRGMRCRPSGMQTGFHNCCQTDQPVTQDSVGTASQMMTMISTVRHVYQMASIAYYSNMAAQAAAMAAQGGSVIVVNASTVIINMPGAGIITLTGTTGTAVSSGITSVGSLATADVALVAQAGMAQYISALINPTTIAIAVVIYVVTELLARSCDQQDMETAMLAKSGYCHFVGDYCESKWSFAGCVQKAKGYCCFNSKLGRIIHEQGRPQLTAFQPSGKWGDAQGPYCRGFTPDEFSALDFGKIDFSEYFADIQTKLITDVQSNITNRVEQFYDKTQK